MKLSINPIFEICAAGTATITHTYCQVPEM